MALNALQRRFRRARCDAVCHGALQPGKAGKMPDDLLIRKPVGQGFQLRSGVIQQGISTLSIEFCQGIVQQVARPCGTAKNDLCILGPMMRLQCLGQARPDFRDLRFGVGQFVNAVDENDHIAGFEIGDQAHKGHVHARQCLMRGQNNNAKLAAADRLHCDLFTHQECVVHAGRVTHTELYGRGFMGHVDVSGFGDVGEATSILGRLRVILKIITQADIAFDQLIVEKAVIMFLAQ